MYSYLVVPRNKCTNYDISRTSFGVHRGRVSSLTWAIHVEKTNTSSASRRTVVGMWTDLVLGQCGNGSMNHILHGWTDNTWQRSNCRANLGCIPLLFTWFSAVLGPVDIKTQILISESQRLPKSMATNNPDLDSALAQQSPTPEKSAQQAKPVFKEAERWNHPRSNILKTLATFWSFLVMGANDAAYGSDIIALQIGCAAIELAFCLTVFWDSTAAALQEATPQGDDPAGGLRQALFTKRSARVTWICTFFLLGYVGIEVALGGWIVTFMMRVRHGEDFASGMVATGFWLGIACGRVVLGFITPRIGEKMAIIVSCGLILWLVPNFYASAVAVSFQGFFLGPFFPAAVIVATKLLPRALHVSAIGFAAAFGGGGAAVLPFVVGAIAQARGVQVLQPFIISLSGGILLLWLGLPRMPKKGDKKGEGTSHNAFYNKVSNSNHDSDTPRNTEKFYIQRPEQPLIDEIVRGNEAGHYWLIFGEKGTGKTSMLVHAMRDIHGQGVVLLDAHDDIDVFRLRLGRALDFAYSEDYLGGWLSNREPRDGTALLDIERAMNSLEKVAIRHRETHGRPLVLVINDIHHIQDDTENGRRLLTLLQQRAESWAAGELLTVVFTSDEYRTSDLLRLHAARMNVLNVRDITVDLAVQSLKEYWLHAFWEEVPVETLERIYSMVGGRLSFVDEIAKSRDILKTCESICERERRWFLKKCWILGKNMHEGAKEQQEYCRRISKSPNSELPGIPLHKAQEMMTRADLPEKLNQMNIISIDDNDIVTASSVPMQSAFRAVCSEDGIKKKLKATTDRLNEIESLERTTEITMKDLVNDGQYEISKERGIRGEKNIRTSYRKPLSYSSWSWGNTQLNEDFTPVFLGHARLYVLADKYGIESLTQLVLEKLKQTLNDFKLSAANVTDIIELVRFTYAHTPRLATGRNELRTLVMMFIISSIGQIGETESFQELLGDGGDFVVDFWQIVWA
ncbi:unnamed protein product [Aspergillus oryzae]|uniref:Unnamed protein product n=1 Tax=Aspergillus oryzae TaxID=5062 RepID=A0AAN4YA41_ASPOZ|nr:unnamed protein product [Aspergillus oryzae]